MMFNNVSIRIDKESFRDCKIPGFMRFLDKNWELKQIEISKVIYSNPATIVLWNDGVKTICRCAEGDKYNPEMGLMSCIAKRIFGRDQFVDVLKSWVSDKALEGKNDSVTIKEARYNAKK